jgi:hypothetical protein
MELFEDAAAAVCDALGEPFVYFDGEATTEVNAVPSSGWSRVQGGRGPAVSSQRREIMITKAEIAAPKQGDLLYRGTLDTFEGEFGFEVVSVRPDDEETSYALVLKAVEL